MTIARFGGLTFDDEATSGFTFSKMTGWYDAAQTKYQADDRPQGHGTFGPGKIYRAARVVSLQGAWWGDSIAEAYAARDALMGIQADGYESPFVVEDLLGSRWIGAGLGTAPTADDGIFSPYFKYSFDVIASDPLKYSEEPPVSTGLPVAASGLVWPLGTPSSGQIDADGFYPATYFAPTSDGFYSTDNLIDRGDGTYSVPADPGTGAYFNWGNPGESGRVFIENTGTAETYTVMDVAGGMSGGVELTWVPTGDFVRLEMPIADTSVVTFDPRTGRVTIDGEENDVTGFLRRSDWWVVPPGASGEIQFNSIGTVTGTPTLTARPLAAHV